MYGWLIITASLVYIGGLFLVAYLGDRRGITRVGGFVYPLSLAVYCTSWTYFGSVGLATRQGLDFLAIYLGPVLMFALFFPFIIHVRRLAREHNITSIADFLAARYGKSQEIAALASVLLLIGMLPYIALQLKAVSASLTTALTRSPVYDTVRDLPFFGDIGLIVTVGMASFAIAFGTRQTDATEHQNGLMLAIAAESIVKLVCFLIVGFYVCYGLFDGFADITERASHHIGAQERTLAPSDWSNWSVMLLLSFMATLLLPRMFHAVIVENHSEDEIRRAAWLFPLYLVIINLFVLPIALAGQVSLPPGWFDSDMFVIALPLQAGQLFVTTVAFIGGLSAATAMVIVVCVALAIMLSNGIVLPLLLKFRSVRTVVAPETLDEPMKLGAAVLRIRRALIIGVMMAAYFYYRLSGNAHLASFGLIAFAAVAQMGPAFFLGLVWRGGNARGVMAGLTVGGLIWVYTLLLPSFGTSNGIIRALLAEGPFGLEFLRPESLFGFEATPLVNGTVFSLLGNLIAYVVFSLSRPPLVVERDQAVLFVDAHRGAAKPVFGFRRTAVTVGGLQDAVARYLGRERAALSFASFASSQGESLEPQAEATVNLIRFAEHLLASAIGAASSRLVIALLLKQRNVSTKAALQLLDDASAAIQYDRDVLQTALEHARQGLAVYDVHGRLQFWNHSFGSILHLPPELVSMGVSFTSIVKQLAQRGEFGDGPPDAHAHAMIEQLRQPDIGHRMRLQKLGLVLEIRSVRMPDGGMVTTHNDITDSVLAADALERANELLEKRVRQRTEELTRLNEELAQAKAEADEANLSKTRFLAAASHDVLQPLNAARLYTTSLVEREGLGESAALVHNIEASLEAVEEILTALLDMSRLDSGTMKPEWMSFRLDELFRQLALEFAPIAAQHKLKLVIKPTRLSVRSDRRLLRRLLENLISNAIKYTPHGEVLVGCRRRAGKVVIEVWDTGIGIPESKTRVIFKEFQRLEGGARVARGLGLGLSIVERIARMLEHRLSVSSTPGKGSVFRLEVPQSAAVPMTRSNGAPEPQTLTPLAGMTVLAIDNEQSILDGMATLLRGWGCTVLTAPDARKAIDAVRRGGTIPDALLVDYHLDESTGIEAVVHLRWRFGTPMPAVLITADRSPSVRDEAREKDIHLLNKPLKPASLRALLAQWKAQAAEPARHG